MTHTHELHPDLIDTLDRIYRKCDLSYSEPIAEPESQEYAAYKFTINNLQVVFRTAKMTPTKVGLFVTIWKRKKGGATQPLDAADDIDFVVIYVHNKDRKGQFVFPKLALIENGVISQHNKGGKRGIRVYPPWDTNLNRQATKTQCWQINYFIDMTNDVDSHRAKKLYKNNS